MPELTGMAARRGWAVPDERKVVLVDELVGIVTNPEMPDKVKVAAFNALRQADQAQYDRDHPEDARKAKGTSTSTVNVSVQTNVAAVELLNRMIDDPGASLEDCAAPGVAGAPGDGGHGGEVDAGTAPQGHQP